jgi:aspartate racemase
MAGVIGVLGGMGPLATLDFLHKVHEETPASRDQDHVPMVVYAVPQVPDRLEHLRGAGESPVPAMIEGLGVLKHAGARLVAIPCNTAHCWYDELVRETGLRILHIADAACDELEAGGPNGAVIGLMATSATVDAGFYQERFWVRGHQCVANTPGEFEALVTPAIYGIKRGELDRGGRLLEEAAQRLLDRGATRLVLACTEMPLGLQHVRSPLLGRSVDATRSLARGCVRYWRSGSPE